MSNQNYHYRNPDFNAEQTDGCTLLMQTGMATFSYAIISQNKVQVLEENISLSELIEPSEEHNVLFGNFQRRVIGLLQSGFTLVPYSLFKPERVADFARFLDVKFNDKVFSQPLDAKNQVLYKVNSVIVDKIEEKFDLNDVVFPAKGWINALAATHPSDRDLYLNISHGKAELLSFKEGSLRFYNTFEFQAADELVYFALLVADELKLHPQGTMLVLSGDIIKGDENTSRLSKFFGKTELSNIKTVQLPGEIAPHHVLTLTALSLCGSSEVL
jgi:hypothetical protein